MSVSLLAGTKFKAKKLSRNIMVQFIALHVIN